MFHMTLSFRVICLVCSAVFLSACEREAELLVSEKPEQEACETKVHINKSDRIWIDGDQINLETLEQRIHSDLVGSNCLTIAASPLATSGMVIRVMNIAMSYTCESNTKTEVDVVFDETYD